MNNYNHNKNGNSVEINLYRYGDGFSYDDNFETLCPQDFRTHAVLQYTGGNNPLTEEEIKARIVITSDKQTLKEYIADPYDLSLDELKREVIDQEGISPFLTKDIEIDYYLEDLEVIASYGYSQGDYIEVLIDKKEFQVTSDLKEEIGHYLWDCPLGGSVTVNDETVELYEIIDDQYMDDEDAKEAIDAYLKKRFPKEYKEASEVLKNVTVIY